MLIGQEILQENSCISVVLVTFPVYKYKVLQRNEQQWMLNGNDNLHKFSALNLNVSITDCRVDRLIEL